MMENWPAHHIQSPTTECMACMPKPFGSGENSTTNHPQPAILKGFGCFINIVERFDTSEAHSPVIR